MTADAARTRPYPRGLALLVAGAYFMEILDAMMITPAMPVIATSLGVRPVDVNVVISAYLLTVAVLIPVSGWLADRFGVRRVFCVAIAVFTVASAGCAASASLTMLIAARVLQGVGGALMVPVGRLAVLRRAEKSDLVRVIALLTWPALTAPVAAVALGGAIATVGSWRWLFLINIPIGVAGLLLSRRLVHGGPAASTPPLDWTGLLLFGSGVGFTLLTVEGVRLDGSDWRWLLVTAPVAVALLGFSVVHLLRCPAPLMQLRVLRVPTLRITVSAGSLYRAVVIAVPFLLPLQLQLEFGWTPWASGLMVAALFLGNLAIKPATTGLMRRFGIRPVLLVNGIASVGGFVLLAAVHPGMPVAVLAAVLALSGVLRSIGFTTYNSLAFADVQGAELTHANTLNASLAELASGLGIASAAVVLSAVGSYPVTYWVLAGLMAMTLIETLRLPRDAGAHVSGRM